VLNFRYGASYREHVRSRILVFEAAARMCCDVPQMIRFPMRHPFARFAGLL
jgi:hypothetical protein